MRILVVDDCKDTVDSLSILLGLWGHDVRVAYDGAEALATASAFKPDVILLDILLPRLNGYQVARQLRQLPELSAMRLVAVTGYAQADDFAKSREAGFDCHLVKPVELEELHAFSNEASPVKDSGLTYEEIQQACRACRVIRIPGSPPGYLREFLATRLDPPAPALAAKIRQLSSEQFTRLCSTIKDKQDIPH